MEQDRDSYYQMLAFQQVLPFENEPEPLVQKEDGINLQLRADQARRVTIEWAQRTYPLRKSKEGLWVLPLPFQSAINYIQIRIDGRPVIHPLLPIAYAHSRPVNMIERNVPGEDFYKLRDVPHGTIRQEIFFSKNTGEWERCLIYTPPFYEEHPEKTYPILYLQHGYGENETAWTAAGRLPFILDNLLADQRAVPFVVVMSNGMIQKIKKGRRIVAPGLFDSIFIDEILPFAESKYHAGGRKEKRGIAGLSMGATHASRIAFGHPELFSEIGIFSGPFRDWIRGLDQQNRVKHPPMHQSYLKILENPAFFAGLHTFFRAIGDRDPFLEFFLEEDEILRERGIASIRKTYPGIHDWNVWRRCLYDFAQLIFRETGSEVNPQYITIK